MNGVSCGGSMTGVACGNALEEVTFEKCPGYVEFAEYRYDTDHGKTGRRFKCSICMYVIDYYTNDVLPARWPCENGPISAYRCSKCKEPYKYNNSVCSKITSYKCDKCKVTTTTPGTCTNITSYTCPTHGGSYSSSGSCTSKVSYTYYTMNCGF